MKELNNIAKIFDLDQSGNMSEAMSMMMSDVMDLMMNRPDKNDISVIEEYYEHFAIMNFSLKMLIGFLTITNPFRYDMNRDKVKIRVIKKVKKDMRICLKNEIT